MSIQALRSSFGEFVFMLLLMQILTELQEANQRIRIQRKIFCE